jgi:hypothetical protein
LIAKVEIAIVNFRSRVAYSASPAWEAVMKTKPLFDRTEIDRIIRSAKSNRVKYLLRKKARTGRVARWGGLGAVAAACLAFFASRFFHLG